MQSLIRYWPLIVSLAGLASWQGATTLAVADNTEARKTAQDERVQAARVEERVQAVQEAQQRQEAQLDRLEAILLERLPPPNR